MKEDKINKVRELISIIERCRNLSLSERITIRLEKEILKLVDSQPISESEALEVTTSSNGKT